MSVTGRALPSLPRYRKDGVTRRLSASVHSDDDFALYVDRLLTWGRLNAIGLSLNIDLVALARHARVATRRRAALGGLVNGQPSLGWAAIFGPLGAQAIAWTLDRHTEARRRTMAREVFLSADRPERTVPPVEPEAETALHELKRADSCLPYADVAAATDPFVGSGRKLKEVVWQSIDISRPADAPGGGEPPIRPFDVFDPHTYVARHRPGPHGGPAAQGGPGPAGPGPSTP
jgi:hypothetical protein